MLFFVNILQEKQHGYVGQQSDGNDKDFSVCQ